MLSYRRPAVRTDQSSHILEICAIFRIKARACVSTGFLDVHVVQSGQAAGYSPPDLAACAHQT